VADITRLNKKEKEEKVTLKTEERHSPIACFKMMTSACLLQVLRNLRRELQDEDRKGGQVINSTLNHA
jgi:hypothetical protein